MPLILFSCFSFLPDHTGIYLIRWSLLSVSELFRNSSRIPESVSQLFLLQFSFIVLLNCPCHSSRLLFLGKVISRVSVLFMWKCSVTQSWLTLCNPMDCSPPGSSVHKISQARILEWVAIFFSRVSSHTRDWTCISCIDEWILYHWATREAQTKPRQNLILSCLDQWLSLSVPCLLRLHLFTLIKESGSAFSSFIFSLPVGTAVICLLNLRGFYWRSRVLL